MTTPLAATLTRAPFGSAHNRFARSLSWWTRLVRTPIACAAAGMTFGAVVPRLAPVQAKPRLVVLIAIDQFRADYLDRFGPQLTGGLARMVRGGARFTNAFEDHAITETAPGHASMLSGRFPRSTGIMMNRIGVEDPASPLIASGYGPGASPRRFIGTTLVDWLHADNARSKSLSVSMKDRAAILPIGKSVTNVYWYSPDGRFVTSSFYRQTLPSWVTAFNDRQTPGAYAGKSWSLLLPDSAYHEADTVAVEAGGKDNVFPHVFPDDAMDAASRIRLSPFMDDVVLAFALHGVQSLALGGSSGQTDLLSISLSATDVIGHNFGPDSREIHDQVLRVDRAIGTFLDSLYKMRDSATVTVVLTSDHGVGRIPELAPADMRPHPTRVSIYGLMAPVIAKLQKAGVDTMAFDIDQQIVLMDRAAFKKSKLDPDSVLNDFAATVRKVPGVARVDRFRALLADSLTDPIARRWSHQFPANVNIELVVTLTPFSTWGGNVASHGSPYDYDAHVPLIFYGAGVRTGAYDEFVRSVDIAPTLAAILGVKPLEALDGVPLKHAIW